jgi:phage terminase small subunit
MRRGPKPTATVLKMIRGNPGRRPLNLNEPKPTVGCAKPDYLDEAAGAVWDRFAPELIRIGVLTKVDEVPFARFCILSAESIANPYAFPTNKEQQLRMYANEFGMTASGRARLSVVPEVEDKPPDRRLVSVR